MIRIKHLEDQTGTTGPWPFLYCDACGQESSANRGDYFTRYNDHPFICCGEPMRLVTKHTVYREVAEP